jgi:hypothetical protein
VSRFVDEHRGRRGRADLQDLGRVAVGVLAAAQRPPFGEGCRGRTVDHLRELHAANYHAYGYRRMRLALRRTAAVTGVAV